MPSPWACARHKAHPNSSQQKQSSRKLNCDPKAQAAMSLPPHCRSTRHTAKTVPQENR